MITLTGKNKVDTSMYDHVWYTTTSNPGMRVGCEHHPELAASLNLHCAILDGAITEDMFIEKYISEMTSHPKIDALLEVIKRSDAGEWFQFIFYEDSAEDGERKYLYDILKQYTNNVTLE